MTKNVATGQQINPGQCIGPSEDWQSEHLGPCNEPIDPSSESWCRAHEEERRAYYSLRFKELGGLVGRLKRTKPRSPEGRRAWIRKQFALLNQELRSGYADQADGD